MNSQIYLMLLRQSGTFKDWKDELKNLTKMTAPIVIKQLLKDIVMGDSLDAPFVKFIRVTSVSHKIGFTGDSKFESSGWAYKDAWTEEQSTQYSPNPFQRTVSTPVSTPFYNMKGFKASGMSALNSALGGFQTPGSWGSKFGNRGFKGNEFVQNRIPEHGEIEFKKHIDAATPQLAYGCSAQEKFPLAIFFYRRKTGLGIGGIRFPYFVTAAFKCKIKDWQMSDDMESVSLYYKSISWCGYEQFADANVSFPWSTRWFDQEQFTGGQGGPSAALQILVAGLVLVAGAVSAGATSDGSESGDANDL